MKGLQYESQMGSQRALPHRVAECFAMMMIGDGALAVVEPQRHMKLWQAGPSWWRAILRPFVANASLTRWVGAVELAAGLWLAHRQRPVPMNGNNR